jgi:hypothetical protein
MKVGDYALFTDGSWMALDRKEKADVKAMHDHTAS